MCGRSHERRRADGRQPRRRAGLARLGRRGRCNRKRERGHGSRGRRNGESRADARRGAEVARRLVRGLGGDRRQALACHVLFDLLVENASRPGRERGDARRTRRTLDGRAHVGLRRSGSRRRSRRARGGGRSDLFDEHEVVVGQLDLIVRGFPLRKRQQISRASSRDSSASSSSRG
jgi:hypothetical protein